MKKGIFITFEGGEGAGKSTQAELLAKNLEKSGYNVLITRDPGGTAIGEKIRAILLDRDHRELSARTELLLYLASRSQLVAQVIQPALEEGKVVISDRFYHSTYAYQGGARELEMSLVRQVNGFATNSLIPDISFLLDLPPEDGLERKDRTGSADRMEELEIDFHRKVRQAFLELAKDDNEHLVVLDARQPVDRIASAIYSHIQPFLDKIQKVPEQQ